MQARHANTSSAATVYAMMNAKTETGAKRSTALPLRLPIMVPSHPADPGNDTAMRLKKSTIVVRVRTWREEATEKNT